MPLRLSLKPSPQPSQRLSQLPLLLLKRHQRALLLKPLHQPTTLPQRPLRPSLAPREFLVLETILLRPLKGWRVPEFLVLETILLPQLREWADLHRVVLVKAQPPVVRLIAKVALGRPSKVARVLLEDAPEVLDLADPEQVPPVADLVLVPVGVVLALEAEAAAPVAEPQELSVVAVARASLVSRSGRSVKSLRCGRPRA